MGAVWGIIGVILFVALGTYFWSKQKRIGK